MIDIPKPWSDPTSNDPDPEEAFTLVLRVQIPGYGRKEHRRKTASNVKRILETSLHTIVSVETRELDPVQWVPVEREDRNAKQARGEEIKDE